MIRTVVLLLAGLMLGAQFSAAQVRIPEEEPIADEPPSAWPTLKVEPEFPVSSWWNARRDIVAYSVLVDTLGTPIAVHKIQGSSELEPYARRALDRWRFRPARNAGGPIRGSAYAAFDFFVERAAYDDVENRVISNAPQALLRQPFSCAAGTEEQFKHRNDFIAVRIDTAGFVTATRFMGTAPPDSVMIERVARGWIFRPFLATEGPRIGQAMAVWVAIPVRRSCQALGVSPLSARDSVLVNILSKTTRATVARLRPFPQENRTIAGTDSIPYWPDREPLEVSQMIPRRGEHREGIPAELLSILSDPNAYTGRGPLETRIRPEPEYGIRIFDGTRSLDVLISPRASFMELRWQRAVVFVPYEKVGGPMEALIRKWFPPASGS